MGDILSQSEIDELLKSINTESVEELETLKEETTVTDSQIKDYNFEKPPKFNKEQLKTLEIIFDNYSRVISSYLTGYLRISTQLEVNSSEQVTFKEFYGSLQNPVIVGILDFHPLKGSVILELSAGIGYAIIDRILGGPGNSIDKLREFSDIEITLIRRVLTNIIKYLVEPWENILPLDPKLEKLETDAQFAQIMSPNEMIALTSLQISVGEVNGFINFCIPHMVIEPVVSKLNNRSWFSTASSDDDENYKHTIEDRIEKADLKVSAVLGKTNIFVSDFVDLKVGDVITLDSYISSDIKVYVSNNMKFYAKPGVVKNKNSIQITGFVREDEI